MEGSEWDARRVRQRERESERDDETHLVKISISSRESNHEGSLNANQVNVSLGEGYLEKGKTREAHLRSIRDRLSIDRVGNINEEASRSFRDLEVILHEREL